MPIVLDDFRALHPDFAVPKKHNGEPMELYSIEAVGPYIVARYFYEQPVEGPKVERRVLDVYHNNEGRETFRVTAKIIDPPPPEPTFRERLRTSIRYLFS